MTTAFPLAIDSFPDPTGQNLNTPGYVLSTLITNIGDAVEALETRAKLNCVMPQDRAMTSSQRAVAGNGLSKPLSDFYANLAAAQGDYSFVTSLTQTLDWALMKSAYNVVATGAGGIIFIPPGYDFVARHALTVAFPGVWIVSWGEVTGKLTVLNDIAEDFLVFDAVVGPPSGVDKVEVRRAAGGTVSTDGISVRNSNGVQLRRHWVNGFRNNIEFYRSGDCSAKDGYSELGAEANYLIEESDSVHLEGRSFEAIQAGVRFKNKRTTVTHTTTRQGQCHIAVDDIGSLTGLEIDNYIDVVGRFSSSSPGTGGDVTDYGVDINNSTDIDLDMNVNHPRLRGYRVRGTSDEVDLRGAVNGVGDYASVPAEAIWGGHIAQTCGRVDSDVKVNRSQGGGTYNGGRGKVTGSVKEYALANNALQGLYGIENDPGADATKRQIVMGTDVRNTAARGTPYRLTTAASAASVRYLGCTHYNEAATAFSNASGVTPPQRACSWTADTG
jgi:hypothetical protein